VHEAGRPPGPAHSRPLRLLCNRIEHSLDHESRGRRIVSNSRFSPWI